MLDIILTLILGLGFAYFATQNTMPVMISFGDKLFSGVPLYLVVLVSILFGVLVSSLVSFMNVITTTIALFRKDQKIKEHEEAVSILSEKVRNLEVENAQLKDTQQLNA